ncbi:MAG: 30S ribosomal protein S17 [Candidatus Pacearchaeota archaeon]|jgi:ribosomal protein S17
MKQKTTNIDEKIAKKNLAGANSKEKYSLRGRKFEGYVIKKFPNRITIKFERVNFIKKFERYSKSYSKMHARLPENLREEINIGDYVQIMECRPLSKIIHFVVIKKIRDADVKQMKISEVKEEIVVKKKIKEEVK